MIKYKIKITGKSENGKLFGKTKVNIGEENKKNFYHQINNKLSGKSLDVVCTKF